MNRLKRVVVACGIGVATAAVTGCFGDTFATVHVSNYCRTAVDVAHAEQLGTSPEEWIRLEPTDETEISINAPGGSPVSLEIRSIPHDGASASTFVQASDRADVVLQNSVCPAVSSG